MILNYQFDVEYINTTIIMMFEFKKRKYDIIEFDYGYKILKVMFLPKIYRL